MKNQVDFTIFIPKEDKIFSESSHKLRNHDYNEDYDKDEYLDQNEILESILSPKEGENKIFQLNVHAQKNGIDRIVALPNHSANSSNNKLNNLENYKKVNIQLQKTAGDNDFINGFMQKLENQISHLKNDIEQKSRSSFSINYQPSPFGPQFIKSTIDCEPKSFKTSTLSSDVNCNLSNNIFPQVSNQHDFPLSNYSTPSTLDNNQLFAGITHAKTTAYPTNGALPSRINPYIKIASEDGKEHSSRFRKSTYTNQNNRMTSEHTSYLDNKLLNVNQEKDGIETKTEDLTKLIEGKESAGRSYISERNNSNISADKLEFRRCMRIFKNMIDRIEALYTKLDQENKLDSDMVEDYKNYFLPFLQKSEFISGTPSNLSKNELTSNPFLSLANQSSNQNLQQGKKNINIEVHHESEAQNHIIAPTPVFSAGNQKFTKRNDFPIFGGAEKINPLANTIQQSNEKNEAKDKTDIELFEKKLTFGDDADDNLNDDFSFTSRKNSFGSAACLENGEEEKEGDKKENNLENILRDDLKSFQNDIDDILLNSSQQPELPTNEFIVEASSMLWEFEKFKESTLKNCIEPLEKQILQNMSIERGNFYFSTTELKFKFVDFIMPLEKLHRSIENNSLMKNNLTNEILSEFNNVYLFMRDLKNYIMKETDKINLRFNSEPVQNLQPDIKEFVQYVQKTIIQHNYISKKWQEKFIPNTKFEEKNANLNNLEIDRNTKSLQSSPVGRSHENAHLSKSLEATPAMVPDEDSDHHNLKIDNCDEKESNFHYLSNQTEPFNDNLNLKGNSNYQTGKDNNNCFNDSKLNQAEFCIKLPFLNDRQEGYQNNLANINSDFNMHTGSAEGKTVKLAQQNYSALLDQRQIPLNFLNNKNAKQEQELHCHNKKEVDVGKNGLDYFDVDNYGNKNLNEFQNSALKDKLCMNETEKIVELSKIDNSFLKNQSKIDIYLKNTPINNSIKILNQAESEESKKKGSYSESLPFTTGRSDNLIKIQHSRNSASKVNSDTNRENVFESSFISIFKENTEKLKNAEVGEMLELFLQGIPAGESSKIQNSITSCELYLARIIKCVESGLSETLALKKIQTYNNIIKNNLNIIKGILITQKVSKELQIPKNEITNAFNLLMEASIYIQENKINRNDVKEYIFVLQIILNPNEIPE